MKKIIGYLLLFMLLASPFMSIAYEKGIIEAVIGFGASLLAVGIIVIGVLMITE